MRTVNALLILLLALPTLAWAQERDRTDYTRLPGYFDFGKVLEFSDNDEVVEIDLSQPLLSLVGRVVEYDDEALADLLAQLDLVHVNVFSYDRDNEDPLIERIDTMAKQLTDDHWDNIVRVRSDEEHVNVFVKLHDRSDDPDAPDVIVSGLTILVLDEEQAAFINIVGEFGLDEIGRVGRHFDIPHMDELGRRHHRDRDREDRNESREDTGDRTGGR